MYSKPRLLQGVFNFEGRGLSQPFPLDKSLSYLVPVGKRAQLLYFRGGNATSELIYIVLMRNGEPFRYFPLGARADTHVTLAVVEDLMADTHVEAFLAAPDGLAGTVVVDIGLVEI
jgi:assimilatory nitrate reductase catalytic subunit